MELISKSFDHPDERPTLPKSHADIVQLGDTIVVRGFIEPSWRWSNDWRPVMGTPSCQMPHTGVVVSGRIRFEMDDGKSVELGPGGVYSIPAGHDAWVVGDQTVQTLDWAPAHDELTDKTIAAGTRA